MADMKCIESGTLQAYLDDELSREEKKRVMQHLETCESCRSYLKELRDFDAFAIEELEEEDLDVDTDAAWATFEQRLSQSTTSKSPRPVESFEVNSKQQPEQRKGWNKLKTTTKKWLISGAAAATLFGSLAIPQVQVAADQFLSIFRVDQVEMVKITTSDIEEVEQFLMRSEEGTYTLQGLGEVKLAESDQQRKQFESLEEAKQEGFDLAKVPGYDFSYISVSPSYKLTLTLDVNKANSMLQQIGADAKFDEQLDNKPFSIKVENTLRADYGNAKHTIAFTKTKLPEITVPKDVSISELRDTMLALPFIPQNVKDQIRSIDQIEKTLPIPYVQKEGSTTKEITVNGSKGHAMTYHNQTYMVWQQNGYVYMLEGYSKDLTIEKLIQFANQIQ